MLILKKQQTEVFSLLALMLCTYHRSCVAQVGTVTCSQSPCKNGGTCQHFLAGVDSVFINSFMCQCPPGTLQPLCDSFVSCNPNSPCMSGGGCSSTISEGSQCSCRSEQLVEPFCTIDCKLPNVQCMNGGTCTHHGLCFCPVGSHGVLCEKSDGVPPVVSNCPDDIDEMVLAGVTSRSVFWTSPTATDSSGYTVSASHESGSQFSVGSATRVTYIFTDSARNQATCTFLVTLQQDVDECSQRQLNSCDIVTSECMNTAGDYFCSCKSGYTGVIYYPSRGGTSRCEDDEPPIISNCPTSPIFVYIRIGQTQGEATWTEPTASDLSGDITFSRSHSPGESFPVGSTQVRYEFRDRFNNVAICPFTVSVYTGMHANAVMSLEDPLAICCTSAALSTYPHSCYLYFNLWNKQASKALLTTTLLSTSRTTLLARFTTETIV